MIGLVIIATAVLSYIGLSYLGVALYFRLTNSKITEDRLYFLEMAPFAWPFGLFFLIFELIGAAISKIMARLAFTEDVD